MLAFVSIIADFYDGRKLNIIYPLGDFYLVNYLFNDGPSPFLGTGDINDDGIISIVDAVALINYIYGDNG